MVCQGKRDARLNWKDQILVDMELETVQRQEITREDAAVMPVGQPRKRPRDVVDPERKRRSPTGGCPVVQQWYDEGDVFRK
jgi:hypothetical protein